VVAPKGKAPVFEQHTARGRLASINYDSSHFKRSFQPHGPHGNGEFVTESPPKDAKAKPAQKGASNSAKEAPASAKNGKAVHGRQTDSDIPQDIPNQGAA